MAETAVAGARFSNTREILPTRTHRCETRSCSRGVACASLWREERKAERRSKRKSARAEMIKMPKLARECLAGRCTAFSRKNAGDAFAYGGAWIRSSHVEEKWRRGVCWYAGRGGRGWCSLCRGYSQGTSTTGIPPNAILPTVNRIQRKCSYVYTHTHTHTYTHAVSRK